MDWIHYFAYGSNMLRERLRARVPSAESVEVGVLTGHALQFHKLGQDGSAKCDAQATGLESDVVHGVVYRMDRREKAILDAIEDLGCGYQEKPVEVRVPGGRREAYLYVAGIEFIRPDILPFSWYKAFVVAGARQHVLPENYVKRLAGHPVRVDEQVERHLANSELVPLHLREASHE